jgi:hypothetical protein
MWQLYSDKFQEDKIFFFSLDILHARIDDML